MKKALVFLVLAYLAYSFYKRSSHSNGETAADYAGEFGRGLAQAKAENKLMLLDFTGSDWCGWCMKLNQEVFSQPEFQAYAAQNLVFMEVDFPRNKGQSEEKKKENQELQSKYGIQGYPTLVVLNPSGKLVGQMGYRPGGARAFILALDGLKGK